MLGYVQIEDGTFSSLTDAGEALCADLGLTAVPDSASPTAEQERPVSVENASVAELFDAAKPYDSTTTEPSTTTGQQYTRKEAVRKLALADADGVCLACSSDAPFLDEDGDPYFELHHLCRRAGDYVISTRSRPM